ncbi:MAG: LysE family translocator [Tagaea sp.]
MSWEFLIVAFVIVATPGTGNIYTVAAGLARGGRAGIVAAFGCTLGIVPHMLAAITGLAALLHASALAFDIVKYAGVLYLLWMAWQTWNDRGALSLTGGVSSERGFADVTIEAVMINLLNPKLSIFFFAFLPQFVAADAPGAVPQMLWLSAVFMAMTFVVFVFYGLFAAAVRDRILSRPAVLVWMRRSFAATFAGLGVKLALVER